MSEPYISGIDGDNRGRRRVRKQSRKCKTRPGSHIDCRGRVPRSGSILNPKFHRYLALSTAFGHTLPRGMAYPIGIRWGVSAHAGYWIAVSAAQRGALPANPAQNPVPNWFGGALVRNLTRFLGPRGRVGSPVPAPLALLTSHFLFAYGYLPPPPLIHACPCPADSYRFC
jgi:hypothetical protein